MSSRIKINRARPPGVFPAAFVSAWNSIWDNFELLREVVGYDEVTIKPSAGTNQLTHRLSKVPRRWKVVRAKQITGAVYESAATTTTLTLEVVSVGASPELVVRVW